ncbi:MAG: hypothetical protein ACK4MV_09130 [Beijerinckiaceae bacterium]
MRVGFELDRYEDTEMALARFFPVSGVCLTKRPEDIFYMRPRFMVDPRVHVICLVRDPRDSIVSKHGLRPDGYYANLGIWKRARRIAMSLEKHPRFLVVKYEDLVRDADSVQDKIAQWAPFLKRKAAFSSFGSDETVSDSYLVALNGVRPISSSSIGNWRKNAARVAQQIATWGDMDEDLRAYDYERDDRWKLELPKQVSSVTVASEHKSSSIKKKYFIAPIAAVRGLITYKMNASIG